MMLQTTTNPPEKTQSLSKCFANIIILTPTDHLFSTGCLRTAVAELYYLGTLSKNHTGNTLPTRAKMIPYLMIEKL